MDKLYTVTLYFPLPIWSDAAEQKVSSVSYQHCSVESSVFGLIKFVDQKGNRRHFSGVWELLEES